MRTAAPGWLLFGVRLIVRKEVEHAECLHNFHTFWAHTIPTCCAY